MFTDIEGSTRLSRRLGDDYAQLISDHNALLAEVVTAHGGAIVRSMGDGIFAAFSTAAEGVAAATAIQERVAAHRWPDDEHVRVRIGLHAGTASPRADDYVSLVVHQAARVASAAHGGQVLVTGEVVAGATGATYPMLPFGAFRLKDFDEPIALFEVAPDGVLGPRPNARPETAHNVPVLRTSFIGRQTEIDSIESLLIDERVPVVTLSGPGGVGKTRLAFEIVLRQAGCFTDGAWTVLLADGASDDVVPRLLRVLGLREDAGGEPLESLVQALADREVLLLLDNCEHVLPTVSATVRTILERCPAVQFLITSREPLTLPGETEWRLAPLSIAPRAEEPAEAVKLFLDRADIRGGRPRSAAELDAIHEICRAVDGLPLAIEIAASRARSLPLPAVAAGIHDAPFLQSHVRGTDERQRSVSDVVEWSYRLLSPGAQSALRRLSMFCGPFDLGDAAAIVDDQFTSDAVAELVDKSLLLLENDTQRPLRMLMIIRQFARQTLTAAGEFDATAQRHVAWALERASELSAKFLGAEPEQADAQLLALFDDFLAAFEHALAASRDSDAAQLAADLSEYLILEGHFEIATRWFNELKLLALTDDDRANVLLQAGVLSYFRGVHNLAGDEAKAELDQALELAERVHNDELTGRVCAELGAVHGVTQSGMGELYYRRALDLGSSYTRVRALNGLGGLAYLQGEYENALSYFGESVKAARAERFATREVIGQFNIANCILKLGRVDDAHAALLACLAPARRAVRALVPAICESLAECAVAAGDTETAVRWLREGASIAQTSGNAPVAHALLEKLEALPNIVS